MKQKSNVLLLACLPAIFVLILLGTGLPQRYLPAVTVGNENYTIAEYNFYYYEAYASYVAEHYNELDEVGLDLTKELKKQAYDENMSWAAYFRTRALADMQEYAILYDAAMAAGFDAGEQVAQVRAEKDAELQAYCIANNIKRVETYLTGLYDAGMTEKIYHRQLERRTTAEAYKRYLIEQFTSALPSSEAGLLSADDYFTADAVVSLFRPGTDRVTGQSEQRQWDNAEILARAALARAEKNGGDLAAFVDAAAAYSELEDLDTPDGHYTALTRADLNEALETWCFDPARKSGDITLIRDETGWYLLYFNGWGESVQALQTRQLSLDQAYADWIAARKADYPVKTHALGMQIAR